MIRITWNYTHGQLGTPKSGHGRVIPMSSALAAALQAHRHLRGKLVFSKEDGSYLHRSRVKHPFWTCIQVAGVPKIRLHDLRHSFASQLVAKGIPLKGVQTLLGHADIRMTMRYAHLSPSETARYVEVLDAPACPVSSPFGTKGGRLWG